MCWSAKRNGPWLRKVTRFRDDVALFSRLKQHDRVVTLRALRIISFNQFDQFDSPPIKRMSKRFVSEYCISRHYDSLNDDLGRQSSKQRCDLPPRVGSAHQKHKINQHNRASATVTTNRGIRSSPKAMSRLRSFTRRTLQDSRSQLQDGKFVVTSRNISLCRERNLESS